MRITIYAMDYYGNEYLSDFVTDRAVLEEKINSQGWLNPPVIVEHELNIDINQIITDMAHDVELIDSVVRYLLPEEQALIEEALKNPEWSPTSQVINKIILVANTIIGQTREISKQYRKLLNQVKVDERHHYEE